MALGLRSARPRTHYHYTATSFAQYALSVSGLEPLSQKPSLSISAAPDPLTPSVCVSPLSFSLLLLSPSPSLARSLQHEPTDPRKRSPWQSSKCSHSAARSRLPHSRWNPGPKEAVKTVGFLPRWRLAPGKVQTAGDRGGRLFPAHPRSANETTGFSQARCPRILPALQGKITEIINEVSLTAASCPRYQYSAHCTVWDGNEKKKRALRYTWELRSLNELGECVPGKSTEEN